MERRTVESIEPAATAYDVVVIGGGQAGLATGYELKRRGVSFVIMDAHQRIGDAWRRRWDSLRLFTPARYDGLPGKPFPASRHYFPTKNEMGDYLESYATEFQLPVQTGMRVDRLRRHGSGFLIDAGDRTISARQVVVAMSGYQKPRVPAFAGELSTEILQLHSYEYRNPSQLREGPALVVGTANSGAEIALDVTGNRNVWLAGRDVGEVPFRIEGMLARLLIPLIFRVVFHRILTVQSRVGRNVRAKMLSTGAPRVRTKMADVIAGGVELTPRVAGVRDGKPVLDDGRVLDVANVIWCTGYDNGFSWIDLDVHGPLEPKHEAGIVPGVPGLYFVGLMFLSAASSVMVHGVGRDAARIADEVVRYAHRSTA